MDVSDQATQQEELALAAALAAQRNRSQSVLLPVGSCHNCDVILADSLLFCDADCRDDWQLRNRIK